VSIDGDDVTGRPAEQLVRRGIVLVQGGKGVFADMTVAENLDVQALTLRVDPRLLDERRELVLSTFPILRQRLSQRAATLSGGEQQQLALAKAVLLGPAIICIDELSLGLAPVVVQELLSIVRAIHRQGTTVILVEQSLNIAADVCERAIFMEKGAVRFEGRTRDLLERDDIARAVFLGSA
jgi:ABC-type branched-subunit amino acid transport system ATPase component